MARAEANAAARAAAAAAPKIYNVGDKIVYRKICLIEGEITHVFREEGKDKNYGYKVKENGSSDSTIINPQAIVTGRTASYGLDGVDHQTYNVGDKIVYNVIKIKDGEITYVIPGDTLYQVKENGSSDSTIVKPEDIIVKRGGRRKSRKSRKLRKTRSNRR